MHTVDRILLNLACQLRAPDGTGTLLRRDSEESCLDRMLFQNDVDNLRSLRGAHVRRARQCEWDWTPAGTLTRLQARPPWQLAAPTPGDLFHDVCEFIPPLWCLVMPDHEVSGGIIVQGLWRGKALTVTRVINGEEVWIATPDEVKQHARHCRKCGFYDANAVDRFSTIVAAQVLCDVVLADKPVN